MTRPRGTVALGNAGAEVCVVGRVDFSTGLGAMTFAACELLSRAYPVCIIPTEPSRRADAAVVLPNGRSIPVCHDPARIKASLYCDVLWNGAHDTNFLLVPQNALRIAWIVFDSDELPPEWVQVLNHRFDLVLVPSPHLLDIVEQSGVELPSACLPIALDFAASLSRPRTQHARNRVRFGSIAAFHPRKGIELVTEAFLRAFSGRPDVDLVLHSNLAFGDTADRVRRLVQELNGTNVTLSHSKLTVEERDQLLRTIDVFVNCSRGESYSVGPREALAAGSSLVLSDVGGHRPLAGLPGVFTVPTSLSVPARYPEIDGRVFGRQSVASVGAVSAAMHAARDFAASPLFEQTVAARRLAAAEWSFDRLETAFASLLDEQLPLFRRPARAHPCVIVPSSARAAIRQHLGPRAAKLDHANRVVQPAHDGGLFSVFNSFVSHLVWEQRNGRCHAVLPDWDVGRMMAAKGSDRMISFCYGQPEDGNLWCRLFQPLFGFSEAEMDDPDVLYCRAVVPVYVHNERRETEMTYVHAYKLYNSRSFAAWRRQYHAVFRQHIKLQPSLAAEIDQFAAQHFAGRFVIAAHVRHPSHTIEQPTGAIAGAASYISRIRALIAGRKLTGDGWRVFLATDQEHVVDIFRREFGGNLAVIADVRRTRAAEDTAFRNLPPEERGKDGYQLQHLVAADRSTWSLSMAREVIRDAWLMARCDVLLHVVSNVSTAIAYMNPDLEMVFCPPGP